jgi:hypothetical protein
VRCITNAPTEPSGVARGATGGESEGAALGADESRGITTQSATFSRSGTRNLDAAHRGVRRTHKDSLASQTADSPRPGSTTSWSHHQASTRSAPPSIVTPSWSGPARSRSDARRPIASPRRSAAGRPARGDRPRGSSAPCPARREGLGVLKRGFGEQGLLARKQLFVEPGWVERTREPAEPPRERHRRRRPEGVDHDDEGAPARQRRAMRTR